MRAWFRIVVPVMAAIAAACGADASTEIPVVTPSAPSGGSGFVVSLNPEVQYPESHDAASGLLTALGTPDLGVGTHRVSFVLVGERGLLRYPVVRAESYYYQDGAGGASEGPIESKQARFSLFPLGTRGIYVSEFRFNRPGTWGIEVSFPNAEGTRTSTRLPFEIPERASAPVIGDAAPRSANRTLEDVDDIGELTTGSEPDRDLYERSIADALEGGRPFVVVFASPAFCTNAFCGPQVEAVSALRERYAGQADFIHVDIYDNPHEVIGDLGKGVRSPLLEEWGLTTDEWTFVVDAEGRIAARFESYAPEEELEQALLEVLEGADATG